MVADKNGAHKRNMIILSCSITSSILWPFRWGRCRLASPCRSRWRSRRSLLSGTPPAPQRTCGGWRTAAASRWWSWCKAARSCWTGKYVGMSFLVKSSYSLALSWVCAKYRINIEFKTLDMNTFPEWYFFQKSNLLLLLIQIYNFWTITMGHWGGRLLRFIIRLVSSQWQKNFPWEK